MLFSVQVQLLRIEKFLALFDYSQFCFNFLYAMPFASLLFQVLKSAIMIKLLRNLKCFSESKQCIRIWQNLPGNYVMEFKRSRREPAELGNMYVCKCN